MSEEVAEEITLRLKNMLQDMEDGKIESPPDSVGKLLRCYADMGKPPCEEELDVQAEFLQLASRVVLNKSRMLVPRRSERQESDEESEEQRSQEMLRHLVQYRRYREVTEELSRRAEKMRKRHPRFPPEIRQWEDALADIEGADLSDLVRALEQVLAESEDQPQMIQREQITVSDCMESLRNKLSRADGSLSFDDIFPSGAGRRVVVVTFVALLEMIRKGEIRVAQKQRFGEITVFSSADSDKIGQTGR